MKKFLFLIAILVSTQATAYDKDAIVFGLGSYEAFDDPVIGANVEFRRHGFEFLSQLSPMAGVELTGNGAASAYAGLLYDIKVTPEIALVPSLALGLYHKGSGQDLGGTFHYRSGIEVDYLASPNTRFGVSLSHKSNAGVYDQNPGTEEITAIYSAGF